MSIQAIGWAIATEAPSPAAKLLLICLANYADAEGGAFPGQVRLSRETGLSLKTVQRHLQGLEGAGLITRNHRHRPDGSRTSDYYYLQLTKGQFDATPSQPDLLGGDYTSNCPGQQVNLTGHEPSDKPSDKKLASLNQDIAREAETSDIAEMTAREVKDILGDGHSHISLQNIIGLCREWFEQGCDRTDILETIEKITDRTIYEPPGCMKYFTPAILEARDERLKKQPIPLSQMPKEYWEILMRSWRQRKYWDPYYGPRPNEKGCKVPSDLLVENVA